MDRRDVRAWREDKKAELRRHGISGPERGTLAYDAERYLGRLAAGTLLHAERRRQLALWCARFGHRPRHTIKASELQAVLDEWLATGLAVSTVKHRRMALLRLFDLLDQGADVVNPVKRTTTPAEPEPEPRGLPIWLVDRLLDALPDQGTPAARGGTRGGHSKARARLLVLGRTGLRPEEVARITPIDVAQARATSELFVRAAKGSASRTIPLTLGAVEALDALHRADAYGQFQRGNLRRSLKVALDRVRLEAAGTPAAAAIPARVTTYDLRHSFATALWHACGDLGRVQAYLGHRSQKMTVRYSKAAAPVVLREALVALERHRIDASERLESYSVTSQ